MEKGNFGAVCEHEKNLWQREHLACYFCLQSTDQGRLGDIWGGRVGGELFIGPEANQDS